MKWMLEQEIYAQGIRWFYWVQVLVIKKMTENTLETQRISNIMFLVWIKIEGTD